MNPETHEMIQPEGDSLFQRVASILEQAQRNVVRSVNTNMVLAYWLIGREIVQALQGGDDRAEYGKQLIENLSARLTDKYGKGFSSPTLWNFRLFYQVYASRHAILSPAGRELQNVEKLHPAGGELTPQGKRSPAGSLLHAAFLVALPRPDVRTGRCCPRGETIWVKR